MVSQKNKAQSPPEISNTTPNRYGFICIHIHVCPFWLNYVVNARKIRVDGQQEVAFNSHHKHLPGHDAGTWGATKTSRPHYSTAYVLNDTNYLLKDNWYLRTRPLGHAEDSCPVWCVYRVCELRKHRRIGEEKCSPIWVRKLAKYLLYIPSIKHRRNSSCARLVQNMSCHYRDFQHHRHASPDIKGGSYIEM